MPLIANWFVGVSIVVSLIISGLRFATTRRLSPLLLQIVGLLLVWLSLYKLFMFPFSATVKGPSEWDDFFPIIGLYSAMTAGMLAQYAYAYFSQPHGNKRNPFDWRNFIAPMFLSPLVFIPLFETLKSAPQVHATAMSMLVAFENGFFFKNFIDHRERGQGKLQCLFPFLLLLAFASPPAYGSECESIPGVTCVKYPGYSQMIHYSKPRLDSRSVWKKLFNIDCPPFNRSVALLIGMSDYKGLNKLTFVYNDVRDMRDYLLNEEQFNDVYIVQDRDIDANSLRRLIVNTFSRDLLSPEDRFIFYYSGHGSPENDGNGHILLWGAEPGEYDPTWDLPISEIKLWSARLPAKHVLFLLDGCGLGLGLPEKSASTDQLSLIAKNGSRTVLAATRGGENSYGTVDGKHSLFTSELLKVLRSGEADPHRYGFTTIDEVSGILQTNLARALQESVNAKLFNPVTPESLDAGLTGQFIFFTASGNYGIGGHEAPDRVNGLFTSKDGSSSAISTTATSVEGPSVANSDIDKSANAHRSTAEPPLLSGTLIATLTDSSKVFEAIFSPDGTQIATISNAGVSVWDTKTFRLLYLIKNSEAGRDLYSPDSLRMVTCDGKTVYLWSAKNGELLNKFSFQEKARRLSAGFSRDGTQVLIEINGDRKPWLKFEVWDATTPVVDFTFPETEGVSNIHSVNYSEDGTRLLALGFDGATRISQVGIWDAKSFRLLDTVTLPKDDSTAYLLPGSNWMISVGKNGSHIIDYETKRTVTTLNSCFGYFGVLSPNGKSVLVHCENAPKNSAQIWDSERGTIKGTLVHSAYLRDAQFSADSERVVTASLDLTARIWDSRTGKLLGTIVHDGEVYSASFSPDGQHIVTTGDNNVVHVFELRESQ